MLDYKHRADTPQFRRMEDVVCVHGNGCLGCFRTSQTGVTTSMWGQSVHTDVCDDDCWPSRFSDWPGILDSLQGCSGLKIIWTITVSCHSVLWDQSVMRSTRWYTVVLQWWSVASSLDTTVAYTFVCPIMRVCLLPRVLHHVRRRPMVIGCCRYVPMTCPPRL